MAGQSSAMIGLSWTDVSVLGSQVFGQALMDSCALTVCDLWYYEDLEEKADSINE